jgi:hypothetical protein
LGLDTVELIMRIEEDFSIDLPDWELSSVRTVGDLYALVLRHLDTTSACLSSKAFYRTRSAMVDALNLSRRSIRPSTSLEPLLPTESRIQRWNEIGTAIDLNFPRLRHSRGAKSLFLKLSFAIATSAVIGSWTLINLRGWHPGASIFSIVPAILIWIVVFGVSDGLMTKCMLPLASELPVETTGDLASMVLTMNYAAFAPASDGIQPLSREYVWERLVHHFTEQLQLEPEDIVPEASIAVDLGVD